MTGKTTIELHDTTQKSERGTRMEVVPARALHEGGLPDAAATPVARQRYESDPNKSSYAGYLFGSSGTDERPALSDSMRGRAGIRLLSRGIVGAAFFVAGGHIVRKQLEGYETWHATANPVQKIAKGIDLTVGRALEQATYTLTRGNSEAKAKAAWEVTNFRTKLFHEPKLPAADIWAKMTDVEKHQAKTMSPPDKWGHRHALNGRSLGAEIVSVTFDFFAASIGDATTRNIIQSLDPNVKQPWLLDKDGHATTRDKGKFDAGKWAQALGRSSFRILTKNAGEDWAAALPYVYQMKWQRQMLAKASPGFKLSADHGWNGGMMKVASQDQLDKGIHKGQVTGDYQLAGLADLQMRFVGYNWYTLMYREAYDAIGRNVEKLRHGGINLALPEHFNPITAAVDGAGFTARYVMKSFIKANLYMNPAVPFFWVFRTPQTKLRSGLADEGLATSSHLERRSAILTNNPSKLAEVHEGDAVILQNIAKDKFSNRGYIHGPATSKLGHPQHGVAYIGPEAAIQESQINNKVKNIFNSHPFESGVRRSVMGHLLNPFGWASYKTGSGLTHAVDWVTRDRKTGAVTIDKFSKWMHAGSGGNMLLDREKTLREFVDASFSYTPYMWAKAETALRVDDRRGVDELGHMDKAIYRVIDNAFTFKFKEAAKAVADVGHLAVRFEKDVKSREGTGAVATEEHPVSKVETKTIAHQGTQQHDPVTLERQGEEDPQQHRRWAETVAGRKLDAQFQSSQPTLH